MLKDKTALITGASGGIGSAIVEVFAKEGANIYAHARNRSDEFELKLQELSEQTGVRIEPVYCDLSNPEERSASFRALLKKDKQIDILVNNAGMTGDNYLFPMTPMQQIRDVFEVNLFAALETTQLLSRVMLRNKRGSVIFVSSVAGLDGDPAQLEYAASKGALVSAVKKLAMEMGSTGIRVNAVAPGLIQTKMLKGMDEELSEKMQELIVLNRLGKPEEVADLIAFLASDRASYITGQTIRVDGGILY